MSGGMFTFKTVEPKREHIDFGRGKRPTGQTAPEKEAMLRKIDLRFFQPLIVVLVVVVVVVFVVVMVVVVVVVVVDLFPFSLILILVLVVGTVTFSLVDFCV